MQYACVVRRLVGKIAILRFNWIEIRQDLLKRTKTFVESILQIKN